MTRRLHSIVFVLATVFLILKPALGEADVTDGYCATYDSNTNNFHIPCLIYGGINYTVDLNVASSNPPTLTVTSATAGGLAPTLGKCATFNISNSTVSIPCVVLGETRYWADFSVGPNAATLIKNDAGIPRSCVPLTQVPSGVTVNISAKGSVVGSVAEAAIRNGTGQQLCFCAMPCMSLANSSGDAQNLTVVKSALLCLAPSQSGTIQLQGSCIDQSKHTPTNGQGMTAYGESRNDLCALAQAIDRDIQDLTSADAILVAQAIWIITDNSPLVMVAPERVKQLFRQAGLNPDNYPGFSAPIDAYATSAPSGPGLFKLKKLP